MPPLLHPPSLPLSQLTCAKHKTDCTLSLAPGVNPDSHPLSSLPPSLPPSTILTEDTVERTLCQIRSVHVFKIPPRVSAGGYRASDWKEEVWQGALKLVQKGLDAAILLNDPKNGKAWAIPFLPCFPPFLYLSSTPRVPHLSVLRHIYVL